MARLIIFLIILTFKLSEGQEDKKEDENKDIGDSDNGEYGGSDTGGSGDKKDTEGSEDKKDNGGSEDKKDNGGSEDKKDNGGSGDGKDTGGSGEEDTGVPEDVLNLKFDNSPNVSFADSDLKILKEKAEAKLEETLDFTNLNKRFRWVQINPDVREVAKEPTLLGVMHALWVEKSGIDTCGSNQTLSKACVSAMQNIQTYLEKEDEQKKRDSERDYSDTTVSTSLRDEFCERIESGCRNSDSEFPEYDGWCNNLENPSWGGAGVPYTRLCGKSFYKDNLLKPWSEEDGFPSPREVSQIYMNSDVSWESGLPSLKSEDNELSVLFSIWGQFVAHDITQASLDFADAEKECPENKEHGNAFCARMQGSTSDKRNGRDSYPFISSVRVPLNPCENDVLSLKSEQVNGYSSFLHGTQIYGYKEENTRTISENGDMSTGRLKSFDSFKSSVHCGDPRCVAIPTLMSLQALFNFEHSRIADELRDAGLSDGFRIFQVARRIVIAELQAITYNTWLPLLLGPNIIEEYKLDLDNSQTKYDPEINPTLFNEFTTAAFRYGHSTIPGIMNTKDETKHDLHESFFINKMDLNKDNYHTVLRGSSNSPCEKVDNVVTSHMKDHANVAFITGVRDIAAMNIGRGRDHGLPPYNIVRGFFKLPEVEPDFDFIDKFTLLEKLYEDIEDQYEGMDLWVGGLSETHVKGGQVGPTFANLIGLQFHNIMFGDRYFFTHSAENNGKGLSRKIRNQILKRTLGDIMCDNNFQLTKVQVDVFKFKSGVKNCKDSNKLDYKLIADTYETSYKHTTENPDKSEEDSEENETPGTGIKPTLKIESETNVDTELKTIWTWNDVFGSLGSIIGNKWNGGFDWNRGNRRNGGRRGSRVREGNRWNRNGGRRGSRVREGNRWNRNGGRRGSRAREGNRWNRNGGRRGSRVREGNRWNGGRGRSENTLFHWN